MERAAHWSARVIHVHSPTQAALQLHANQRHSHVEPPRPRPWAQADRRRFPPSPTTHPRRPIGSVAPQHWNAGVTSALTAIALGPTAPGPPSRHRWTAPFRPLRPHRQPRCVRAVTGLTDAPLCTGPRRRALQLRLPSNRLSEGVVPSVRCVWYDPFPLDALTASIMHLRRARRPSALLFWGNVRRCNRHFWCLSLRGQEAGRIGVPCVLTEMQDRGRGRAGTAVHPTCACLSACLRPCILCPVCFPPSMGAHRALCPH